MRNKIIPIKCRCGYKYGYPDKGDFAICLCCGNHSEIADTNPFFDFIKNVDRPTGVTTSIMKEVWDAAIMSSFGSTSNMIKDNENDDTQSEGRV